jgi:hypothetical protein
MMIPLGNGCIAKRYGVCSKQDHRLQLLEQNEEQGKLWLEERSHAAGKNKQGCQFFQYFSRSRALHGQGENCFEAIECNIRCSRLIAIYKLPCTQFWKGVVTRRYFPKKYIFEGSHRCNLSCGQNQCMTESHLNLETWWHNARRRLHHSGKCKCSCRKACIGSEVYQDPMGGNPNARVEPTAIEKYLRLIC